MNPDLAEYTRLIDHSLLKPTMASEELEAGLQVAIEYQVASVCLLPYYAGRCAEVLAETPVKTSTVIGFPHGCHSTATKLFEAEDALQNGCRELDTVVNVSRILSGDWKAVETEIHQLTRVAHDAGQKIKIIFENCYLQREHKIRLCDICNDAQVDWTKTSTGFGSSGATEEDLKLMLEKAEGIVQVKASGGIRDFATLQKFKNLGVTRIGLSQTAAILSEAGR